MCAEARSQHAHFELAIVDISLPDGSGVLTTRYDALVRRLIAHPRLSLVACALVIAIGAFVAPHAATGFLPTVERPLRIAVIGGLVTATAATLALLPSVAIRAMPT
jgi:cobalt-zinc-cadmium resistance protein CzcA